MNIRPAQEPMVSIRDLQLQLPWTIRYHRDFRASPMSWKDFGHALLHVTKALGKLAAVVNDAEHGGSEFTPEEVDPYVADLVICALRLANTCPGRVIDLEAAVLDRIEGKNGVKLRVERSTLSEHAQTLRSLLRRIMLGLGVDAEADPNVDLVAVARSAHEDAEKWRAHSLATEMAAYESPPEDAVEPSSVGLAALKDEAPTIEPDAPEAPDGDDIPF